MNTPTDHRQAFDRFAERFDTWHTYTGGPLRTYLKGVLDHGERALDLGCGTGQHARMLADRYRHVLGVDISAGMLRVAGARNARPTITYQQRDLREVTSDRDGHFDLVLSAYALHHIDNLDQTLDQIRGLIRPGGRIVIVDNVAPQPAVPRRWFIREARRTLLRDLLRRPLRKALEIYRFNTSSAWLEHVTTDRFLNPAQFTERYGRVFPDAVYTDLYRARALCWDAPTDPS